MTKTAVLTLLAIASAGLTACGDDDGGEVKTVTVTETSAQSNAAEPPADGDAVLIETRVSDAKNHKGEVAGTSVIGESPFCRGGTTTGGSEGPTITTTIRCDGGTLVLRYAPMQPSLTQAAVWAVVEGTGSFKGMRGGGWMAASFKRDNPDSGREVFAGTMGR